MEEKYDKQQNIDPIKQKLKFRITEVTSQEEGYPVNELLNHSPYSKGWQSSRFCDYPQEIVVEFPNYVKVKQLQFLSHQYKITSKIEILIFNPKQSKKFRKIGFLSLDSNEQTNFQARELKSVYIDYECIKIRLVLHRCFTNQLNQNAQIGLIAFNVLGNPIMTNPFDQPPNFNKNPNLDKLEDELLYDPVTYKRLKALERAKLKAIELEDFDEAQKIKEAIDRLKSVSSQLILLEERKAIAIRNDELQAAKIIKFEIERLRNAVTGINLELQQEIPDYNNVIPSLNSKKYNENQNENQKINRNMYQGQQIGEYDDPNMFNKHKGYTYNNSKLEEYPYNSNLEMVDDKYMDRTKNINQGMRINNNNHQQSYNHDIDNRNLYENQGNKQQNLKINNVNQAKPSINQNNQNNQVEDPDERPIKGVESKFENIISTEIKKGDGKDKKNQINKSKNEEIDNEEEEIDNDIPANLYKYAEPLIAYISHDLSKLIFSDNWRRKEKGLQILIEEIKQHPNSTLLSNHPSDKIVTSVIGIVAHTLTSTVSHVLLESMEVIKVLLNKFHNSSVKGYFRGDLDGYMDNCLILLMEKLGDSNHKVKERAENTTLEIANNTIFGSKIVFEHLISGQIKKSLVNSARHLTGRLELIHRMIQNFGLNSSEVGVQSLLEFAMNSFRHANKDVRNSAFNVVMSTYQFIGGQVRSYFSGLRQAQIEILEEGFEKIDEETVKSKYKDDNEIVLDKKSGVKSRKIKEEGRNDDEISGSLYNQTKKSEKTEKNNVFSSQNPYEEGKFK